MIQWKAGGCINVNETYIEYNVKLANGEIVNGTSNKFSGLGNRISLINRA